MYYIMGRMIKGTIAQAVRAEVPMVVSILSCLGYTVYAERTDWLSTLGCMLPVLSALDLSHYVVYHPSHRVQSSQKEKIKGTKGDINLSSSLR